MAKRSSGKKDNYIPQIVVETPSNDNLPFVDDEAELLEARDATPEILPQQTERKESLRRNSISLPNLDDLEVLKDKVAKISDNAPSDEEISDDEIISYRTPLRNARRKSVTSPRMLRPPRDEESGSNSPANSVASNNSFASLLREKIQIVPEAWKKKSPDYKTKIFVAILFIAIVVLIICAYFLYHQKILQKAYFEKIKINNVKKIMRIYDGDGDELIRVRLGTTVTYNKVFPCLPEDIRNGSTCFEWMHSARLYLMPFNMHNGVKCYNLRWISLSKNTDPTDCFTMNGDHWYGGGQTAENAWPLEKGNHTFHPFITGRVDKHEWGNVLKRYFISSKGAAIIVDNKSPLYVSVSEDSHNKELCIKAKYDDFAFVNKFTSLPELNYSICAGSNMSELHTRLTESTLWDGLKKEDVDIINNLFSEPLWEIHSPSKEEFTEETITNFTNYHDVLKVFKLGHVLINEFWQKHIGDFEMDESRFPTLDSIETLSRRGFRIVLSIQPYISTESYNFAEAVKKRLLVSERFSDWRIPALTRYKSLESAGVLDVTNNRTIPWLVKKLKNVIEKYKINAYNLDFGTAYNMPHYYQCEKPLINPDHYKTLFINSLQGSINILGVNSAIERPRPPAFVFLPPFESSWDGLRRIIPTILTYGILGLPFVIPGAVGGDYGAPEMAMYSNSSDEFSVDQELYIRWLQLSTFLPVVRYKYLPSVYSDKKILDAAKQLSHFREKEITPVFKNFSKEAINSGTPIIRPLWMLDANDPSCHTVMDEFAIGDEIIVAPILYPGAKQREVYLPAGVWKDGIDKSMRKGSRWIHDYKVEDNEIAYFKKMPDNIKF